MFAALFLVTDVIALAARNTVGDVPDTVLRFCPVYQAVYQAMTAAGLLSQLHGQRRRLALAARDSPGAGASLADALGPGASLEAPEVTTTTSHTGGPRVFSTRVFSTTTKRLAPHPAKPLQLDRCSETVVSHRRPTCIQSIQQNRCS